MLLEPDYILSKIFKNVLDRRLNSVNTIRKNLRTKGYNGRKDIDKLKNRMIKPVGNLYFSIDEQKKLDKAANFIFSKTSSKKRDQVKELKKAERILKDSQKEIAKAKKRADSGKSVVFARVKYDQ